MNAEFNGKVYTHPMIAERQREVWVSVTALQMMQAYHCNQYFSFRCVPPAEAAEWLRKADALAPPVRIETDQ